MAVVVALILVALPAMRATRIAAMRIQRRNALKQIGLAFLNFHDTYGRLPPAVRTDELGRPLSSWRFQLTPFLEAWMLDVEYEKAFLTIAGAKQYDREEVLGPYVVREYSCTAKTGEP